MTGISLLPSIQSHLSSVFSSWKREESLSRQLGHTLHLVGTMVSWRKGSRVPNGGRVAQVRSCDPWCICVGFELYTLTHTTCICALTLTCTHTHTHTHSHTHTHILTRTRTHTRIHTHTHTRIHTHTQILLEIISEPDLPDSVLSVALHLATSLLLLSDVIPDTRPLLTAIVREVCGKTQAVGLVTEFFKELAGEYSEFQNVSMCHRSMLP